MGRGIGRPRSAVPVRKPVSGTDRGLALVRRGGAAPRLLDDPGDQGAARPAVRGHVLSDDIPEHLAGAPFFPSLHTALRRLPDSGPDGTPGTGRPLSPAAG